MLFSATTSTKTEMLMKLALKKEPVYVGVDDAKQSATVEGLEQGYVICPSEKRFLLLFTFLKKNKNKKVRLLIRPKDYFLKNLVIRLWCSSARAYP